jgi:hypothetical protein
MSAVGQKVAVIGLGMSCQSSAQIRSHVPLLARLTGDETLKISAMPFDDIICVPDSAASMLQADTFYPADPDAIVVSQGAHWRDLNVYFWHEYRLHKRNVLEHLTGRVNARRAYRELSSKYAHLTTKFRQMRKLERLVFVISNSQNNLRAYSTEIGIDPKLTAASVERLCDACDTYFGRPCEYVLATYEARLSGDFSRDRLTIFKLTPDGSDWEGDPAQWRSVFERYFARSAGAVRLKSGTAFEHGEPTLALRRHSLTG